MLKFYRSVLAAGAVALGLAACGDNVTVTNPPTATPVVHSVTVVPASLTATLGQTGITFVASVVADSGLSSAVTWSSTNQAVATVSSSGAITTVAAGQTTIVATSVGDPSKTGAGSLTVVALPSNISSFTATPSNANIAVGATLQASTQISQPAGAPAATITWASNATGTATVSATGQITGVSTGTAVITATATSGGQTATASIGVTVGSGPNGLISFSVSPAAMTLFAGATQQATATVVPNTFAVTWTSLAPSVATVSATGLVTGVAQGTAIINATIGTAPNTVTQSIVVTVAQSATISLASVTAGATAGTVAGCAGTVNAPVVLTNVNCQIDVNINLTAGVQPVDSLTVWITQGGVTKKLARQTYNNAIPASGIVTLSINTANFTKNVARGTAVVDLWNGPSTLTAQVWPHVGASGSVVNCQIGAGNADPTCSTLSLVFTNADGWSADMTKCDSVIANGITCAAANPAARTGGFAINAGGAFPGTTYWGGPTPSGQITGELYAVVYNDNPGSPAGSLLNRCNNTLGDGTGCIKNVSWSLGSVFSNCGNAAANTQIPAPATGPFFREVIGTGTNSTNSCSGYENIGIRRDNVVVLGTALDAFNNAYPGGNLIPNTIVFGATPDSNRFDYKGPSSVTAPQIEGAENFRWVNAIWPFKPTGTLVTDNGVGPAPTTWQAFASLNGGSVSTFPTLVATGADLAETNQNCSGAGCDGYNARAAAADLLGNGGNSGVTSSFGDDRTAPMLRISAVAAPSSYASIYTSGGTASVLDSTTYNAIEGVYGANVVTAGAQTLFLAAAAGTNDSLRVEALDNRSGLSRGIEATRVFAQNGVTGATSTVNSTSTATFGPATIDGWLPALAFHVTNGRAGGAPPANPGYYTTTEYVVDKAGNVSGCPVTGNINGAFIGVASVCTAAAPSATAGTNTATGVVGANLFARRTLALDPGQPAVTGVSPNNSYTGNNPATFTLGSQNDLEVVDARLRLVYPSLYIGDGTTTASNGLVWSYALSNTFQASGFSAGAASGSGTNFGFFAPIGTRWDNSLINPSLAPLTIDQFTLSVQETCTGAAAPTATCAINGDPVPAADVAFTKPNMTPTNVAVQVRDVFGSWIFNVTAGAATGVSAEFVSPILPATVAAPGGYAVTYFNAGALTSCPQGGVVQAPNTVSCVSTGINFRAEPSLSSASTKVFRATESLSTTLPVFTRADLYGLNAANEWVFIQRCTVPASITPNGSAQACGLGTVTGTDNGNERYWLYSFTTVASAGFTKFRAIGTNSSGFGLASTRQ